MPKIKKQTPVKKVTRKRKTGGSAVSRIESAMGSEDDFIKINLYGRSGTGKTTLWSSFPKPILALVCSGGSKPGELRSIAAKDKKQIDKVVLEKSEDLTEIIEYQSESNKYATIVLDHASGLSDLVLKEILGLDEAPVQLSWGLATQQQWGQLALRLKRDFRSILNLDSHVVIVAQEREFNTDDSSELVMPFVASALTPSVVGWLNPAVDFICQTFIRKEMKMRIRTVGKKEVETETATGKMEYCLRTGPDDVYTTKFRLPKGTKLPKVLVNPDYSKLVKLIKGG